MPKARRRPYTPRMPAEDRREQLLDAALQIIARDGYGALSIESISREADVTRPVVYNVFDGLDALLFALLDRQERRALDQLAAKISLTPDLSDLDGYLTRTVRDLAGMVLGDPLTWRPIFLAHGGTPVAVRERIDRDREVVRKRMQQVVELALTLRGGRDALDPTIVSHALIGIGEHFGRLLLERPEAVDLDHLSGTVSAMLATMRP
ncbi:TetR/AcrR family transcriptional regulator [Patulibacter minatonensis]|uniref:TetR/AcrR family transcriptional regulator n=1 Tax=Patulibacter minatonensis TaxID=298163 RepID=UPI0012F8770F|nr:TetR family transcriptional regulator [Patulibacter minatonensis]